MAAPVAGILVLVSGAWWGGLSHDNARTGSARMLCVVEDPGTPCDSGLTFLPVSGPAAAAR